MTWGLGVIGERPIHSFIPEFEVTVPPKVETTLEFTEYLSKFFMEKFKEEPRLKDAPQPFPDPIIFVVAGFDEGEAYGRKYIFDIPNNPKPKEQHPGKTFGINWGGQHKICRRLIKGYDSDELLPIIQAVFTPSREQFQRFSEELQKLELPIPYAVLSLQDAINLAIVMIRTTIELQDFMITVRGCGGNIDIAVITPEKGFQWIQRKKLEGEYGHYEELIPPLLSGE